MAIKLSKPTLLKKETPVTSAKTDKEKAPKTEKKSKSKLPPDSDKDEITPMELKISDTAKLVFSVKRAGEEGLPHVDIRTYLTTEVYTGFTKKGINMPLEMFEEFMNTCTEINQACTKKGL
jgi:hypothetical protein